MMPPPPCDPSVMFPLLYVATVMPFEIFFVYSTKSRVWAAIQYLLTALFLLDIIISINFA